MLTSCPRCDHTFRTPCCGGGAECGGWGAGAGAPLSFILPEAPINPRPPAAPTRPLPPPAPDTDLLRLTATLASLHASGWYFEGLTWQESAALLAPTAPGTFLLRDSSDPRYLFSLSVQTEKGPTSVRIHYVGGYFRLDAEPALVPAMPLFDCVVKLIEYYVALTREPKPRSSPSSKEQVWIDARGQMYSRIQLRTPLRQKGRFPSLQHLARLAINALLKSAPDYRPHSLDLPLSLKDYLSQYPHSQ